MADLFKLQDQVVARIANSLRVELVNAESRRPRQQNLDAVDLTMRGWALMLQSMTREQDQAAWNMFEQAVKLDPGNAEAYAGIAYCYTRDFVNGWIDPGTDYAALVIRAADQALAIDSGNAMAAYAKGLFLATTGRFAEAKTVIEAALQRNPNFAPLYDTLSITHDGRGEYQQAISDLEKAMRLSPHDPQLGIWEYHDGLADLGLGHSAEAVDEERRSLDDGFGTYWPHQALAAAYALLGRDNEAKAELAESSRLNPHVTSIKSLPPLSNIPRLIDGLRKAGMPEE